MAFFFVSLKRLVDIYGGIKKAILVMLIFGLIWLGVYIFTILPMLKGGFILDINPLNNICCLLLSYTYFLFLCFRKGVNSVNKIKLWRLLVRIIFLSGIIFGYFKITSCFFSNSIVIDWRMTPSIAVGDGILASKIFKNISLGRGDIVCIKDKSINQIVPMRIIGLPNEELEIKNDEIYINNETIEDKYGFYGEYLKPMPINEHVKLDSNSYYLLGDNRYYQKGGQYLAKSKVDDTRIWQNIISSEPISLKVTKDDILGKVVIVYYRQNKEYKNIKLKEKREKTGIMLLIKGVKLEHNPSNTDKQLYGKDIK